MGEEVSRALGLGSEVEYKGKTYKLSPWNYGIQAAMEQWLKRNSFREIQEQAAYLPPEEIQAYRSALLRDISAGLYAFGSKAMADSLKELPGLKELIFQMIHDNDPGFTRITASEMVEEDVARIMDKINESMADPTTPAKTPANP